MATVGVKEIICIGYVTYSRYFVVMQPNTTLSHITSCNRWSTDTAGRRLVNGTDAIDDGQFACRTPRRQDEIHDVWPHGDPQLTTDLSNISVSDTVG